MTSDYGLSEKQYVARRDRELRLSYLQACQTDLTRMVPIWKAEFAAKSMGIAPKPYEVEDLMDLRRSRGIESPIVGELAAGEDNDKD